MNADLTRGGNPINRGTHHVHRRADGAHDESPLTGNASRADRQCGELFGEAPIRDDRAALHVQPAYAEVANREFPGHKQSSIRQHVQFGPLVRLLSDIEGAGVDAAAVGDRADRKHGAARTEGHEGAGDESAVDIEQALNGEGSTERAAGIDLDGRVLIECGDVR